MPHIRKVFDENGKLQMPHWEVWKVQGHWIIDGTTYHAKDAFICEICGLLKDD